MNVVDIYVCMYVVEKYNWSYVQSKSRLYRSRSRDSIDVSFTFTFYIQMNVLNEWMSDRLFRFFLTKRQSDDKRCSKIKDESLKSIETLTKILIFHFSSFDTLLNNNIDS